MIKFWKSAAKGKSGCPVRPPEHTLVRSGEIADSSGATSFVLEPILEHEESSVSTAKKSRLSITLCDVLAERNTLNYFIQYMESVGALPLIKFWIELENFKILVTNLQNNGSSNTHGSISRTRSFDLSDRPLGSTVNNHSVASRRHSYRVSRAPSFDACNSKCEEDFILNYSSKNVQTSLQYQNSDNISETDSDCQDHSKAITEEAINLFKKYVALEAPNKLDLTDNIRKIVISNICHPDGLVEKDCFKVVQDIIYIQLATEYFDGFQKSPLYTKAQIDVLTNGSLVLEDILYNEMILFYFTEYLEQESCSILLEFLISVMHFSDNILSDGTYSPDQALDDAVVLYDKYFSLQAFNPIGFPTEVRLSVEEMICREGGPLPNSFHQPFRIVCKTLSRYVKSFLESELYYKYLSEMINSVDQSWRSPKKSLSDCSSEFSINTQNTLLAMGDTKFRKKKRNHSVPDMTIDSNQLYNGDSLWHRKKQDGLNLGRVNSLGRFESKFEPDPDKKEKSVLKKMVSRLVPRTTSQVEEEMAWQVAHMIVKDITDLTMSPPDNEE